MVKKASRKAETVDNKVSDAARKATREASRKRKQKQRRNEKQDQTEIDQATQRLKKDVMLSPDLCYSMKIESAHKPNSVHAETLAVLQTIQACAQDIHHPHAEEKFKFEKQLGQHNEGTENAFTHGQSKRSKEPNIKIMTEVDDFSEHLETNLSIPLLILGRSALGRSLVQGKKLPQAFLACLDKLPKAASVSIQDYDAVLHPSNDAPIHATTTTVGTLKSRQVDEGARGTPYNCLDMGPQFGVHMTPPAVEELDLFLKARLDSTDTARPISKSAKETEQFTLISEKGSASLPHIDGPQATWIFVITGKKLWFYGTPIAYMGRRDLHRLMDLGVKEPAGMHFKWNRVLLTAGDLLYMPPGLIHAVYTPEDCVCVGGFCLTRGSLADSMSTAVVQLGSPDLTNDDLLPQIPAAWLKGVQEVIEDAEKLGNNISPKVGYECEQTARGIGELLALLPDPLSRRKKSILASPDFDEALRVFLAKAKAENLIHRLKARMEEAWTLRDINLAAENTAV